MDIEDLKEKLDAIESTITIYRSDIDRMLEELEEEYGITEDDFPNRIKEIDKKIKEYKKKRRRLMKEIEEELDNING